MIKHIAFTMYSVKDMARARNFYEKKLHLKPAVIGDRWHEYHLGNGAFAITTALPDPQSAANIAFEVDDLDNELARLRKAGVKILNDDIESPVCWMAVIADPDGNSIILHEKKN
ncbi:MAG: VOC family protein [Elusimicrobia bacterium]|nr:VOC family protein [Elusimicrobiota bacterium]